MTLNPKIIAAIARVDQLEAMFLETGLHHLLLRHVLDCDNNTARAVRELLNEAPHGQEWLDCVMRYAIGKLMGIQADRGDCPGSWRD